MLRNFLFLLTIAALVVPANAQGKSPDHAWIATSNQYTDLLLHVQLKHAPESGSRQGLSQYDELISQPTLADEDLARQEEEDVLAKLKSALATEKQKEVRQDLEIIIRNVELNFKIEDYQRAHEVPFINASGNVFEGVRILLDEQTPEARRPAAVVRIRRYAGLDPGYKPFTEILKQRVTEQMAKPGVI